jgi:hypothetical protein
MLINVAFNHPMSGEGARRYYNSHPNIVPNRAFSAVDGEVAVRSAMTGNSPRLRGPWIERSGRMILASPAIRTGCETLTPSKVG